MEEWIVLGVFISALVSFAALVFRQEIQ